MFDSAKPMHKARIPTAVLRSFWLLGIALCFFLMITSMVQQYQFVDGLWYGAIAKNYAEGHGSFWHLQLSQTIENPFLGHPPLHFFFESIFFSLFGNSLLVERGYCLITFFINAYLLYRIWALIFPEHRRLVVFPLLLFVSNEDIYLSTSFNLIECTLAVFTSLAVYFGLLSVLSKSRFTTLYIVLSAVMIFLGGLTKGLPALFPLAVFACVFLSAWLVDKNNQSGEWTISFKQTFSSSVLSLLVLVAGFFALNQYPPAHSFFQGYWGSQVLGSLSEAKEVGIFNGNFRAHRFHIFIRLLEKLIPVFIFLVLVLFMAFRQTINWRPNQATLKRALLFLFIALAGTLPFAISLKQASYYLFPAYAFWIMAACALVLEPLKALLHSIPINENLTKVESLKFNFFSTFTFLLLGFSLFYTFVKWDTLPRSKQTLWKDFQSIGEIVPAESIIHCDRESIDAYVVGYLARFENVSVDLEESSKYEFRLVNKETNKSSMENYEPLNLALNHFYLFKRKP